MIDIDSALNSIDKGKKCTMKTEFYDAGLNIKMRTYAIGII
jgi:hypothetical protein